MNKKLSLQSWLDHLRWIAPMTGVVHVGAGVGAATTRYAEWEIPLVVLVEADERHHDKLNAAVQGRAGWSAHVALVSDTEGGKDFYVASNPNESGVLSPERLSGIWPNLKAKEQRSVTATTLASLLKTASLPSEMVNWAIIDCIPALPIIKGSDQFLDEWEVIVARVVFDKSKLAENGAAKAELDTFLSTRGYRCLAWEEELQPAVGMALYVRDWKGWLRSCMTDVQTRVLEQTKIAAERHARIEHLSKARDDQSQLIAQCQQQVERLTKAADDQAELAEAQKSQLEQLTKACDEQAKLASEREQLVEQLTKTRNEQVKVAAERQAQLEQFKKTVDEQTKMAAERLQQVEQLTQTQAALQQQVAQLKEQLEKRANNEADLKHELVDARQSATLSVKLQTLREADLKDLQSRYQVALSTQENQHQLLVKLSERLSLASSYFHQLANSEITSLPSQQKKGKPRRTTRAESVGKLPLKND
jgi:hypothetical protein